MDEETKKGKREANNFIRDLKIITAISLGKNRNKDLAKVLDTDKSHASKKIKELEIKGLVTKLRDGKKVIYKLNSSAVSRLLHSRVVIVKGGKKNERREETESGN